MFSSVENAEAWIARHRLNGTLTEYPIDRGVYDLIVEDGHWTPSKDHQRMPEFIGTFSSAYPGHAHYENGIRIA